MIPDESPSSPKGSQEPLAHRPASTLAPGDGKAIGVAAAAESASAGSADAPQESLIASPRPLDLPEFDSTTDTTTRVLHHGSSSVIKGDRGASQAAHGFTEAPLVPSRNASSSTGAALGHHESLEIPALPSGGSITDSPAVQSQKVTYPKAATIPAEPSTPEPTPRDHFLPLSTVALDSTAEARVREQCLKRRNCRQLLEFPPSAKAEWLDRLCQWHGRVLVAHHSDSAVDRLEQAWLIGDVHGDLVGLLAALDVIKHQSQYRQSDVIILLGDLIDDLAESEQVLSEISSRIDSGERIVILVGNHDDALEFREDRGFGASVDPSDYCQQLRAIADGGSEHESLRFARSFVGYVRHAPVALFLEDGTLTAHGGVPHTDLLDTVSSGTWGEDPFVWSDFIWARLHPRAKSRMAVGGTRSRELGADDFRRFTKAVSSQLGFEPVRMIRGHDHIEARYELYGSRWNESVLTINNMSWKLPREAGIDGPRNPCIVRWTRGEPAQPLMICMDSEWRRSMQPESSA